MGRLSLTRSRVSRRPPAELEGAISLARQSLPDSACLVRRVAELDRGVGRERLAEVAAEELVDRHVRALAFNVPQRLIDTAQRVVQDRSVAPIRADESRLVDVLNVVRLQIQFLMNPMDAV